MHFHDLKQMTKLSNPGLVEMLMIIQIARLQIKNHIASRKNISSRHNITVFKQNGGNN